MQVHSVHTVPGRQLRVVPGLRDAVPGHPGHRADVLHPQVSITDSQPVPTYTHASLSSKRLQMPYFDTSCERQQRSVIGELTGQHGGGSRSAAAGGSHREAQDVAAPSLGLAAAVLAFLGVAFSGVEGSSAGAYDLDFRVSLNLE